MWYDFECYALQVGVPLDVIWGTTPATALKVYESYVNRIQDEANKLEIQSWRSGYYNALAWHQPKKFPKKPSIKKHIDIDDDVTAQQYENEVVDFLSKLPVNDEDNSSTSYNQ